MIGVVQNVLDIVLIAHVGFEPAPCQRPEQQPDNASNKPGYCAEVEVHDRGTFRQLFKRLSSQVAYWGDFMAKKLTKEQSAASAKKAVEQDAQHAAQQAASKEPISLAIVDGEPFFAHEVTVNFMPTQFVFDFKCITPRSDPRNPKRGVSFQMKHNIVMLEPWHAKAVWQVLGNVIKRYEDEFGVIQKPKSVEIAEKKQQAAQSKAEKEKAAKAKEEAAGLPTYLG